MQTILIVIITVLILVAIHQARQIKRFQEKLWKSFALYVQDLSQSPRRRFAKIKNIESISFLLALKKFFRRKSKWNYWTTEHISNHREAKLKQFWNVFSAMKIFTRGDDYYVLNGFNCCEEC